MSDDVQGMQDYVRGQVSPVPGAPVSGPPDFTDQYNTPLDPGQELQYQQWLQLHSALNQRDMNTDNRDYDMRGAFASGAGQTGNMHWPDTFKKPNHPTFSEQSQYHGVDGHVGGTWVPLGEGRFGFTPGPTNFWMRNPQDLQRYFQRAEPNSFLNLGLGR